MDWEFPVGLMASVSSLGLFAFLGMENFHLPPFMVDAKL